MPSGLNNTIVLRMNAVFTAHPVVKEVILYGSRAMGTFKVGSDIDLTLDGESLSTSELNRIERELDDLLLPYQIDVSIKNQISNPELLNHIERVGVKIYQQAEHTEVETH